MNFGKLRFGLAPMAGYTDAAFRLLCRGHGADFSITELISAESIVRGNREGKKLAFVSKEERPTGIQLFGSNPKTLAKAAAMLEKSADFIDLNFGCPAQKVLRNNGGAALLAKPELIGEIVREVKGAVKKPVTGKMRLGISNAKDAVRIAKIIEDSGASALFVHGRTLKQVYSGEADWKKIAEIKKALSIPVFGNGNIRSYADAKARIAESDCNGTLIGRAALGNPFIFDMCRKRKDYAVSAAMRRDAFFEYCGLREKLGMRESLGDVKSQALQFASGFPRAAALRLKIALAKETAEIMEIFTGVDV